VRERADQVSRPQRPGAGAARRRVLAEGKKVGARKVIYKITYPNGKIYIGKDLTASEVANALEADEHVRRPDQGSEKRQHTVTHVYQVMASLATPIQRR
jgi:hypothetical protein